MVSVDREIMRFTTSPKVLILELVLVVAGLAVIAYNWLTRVPPLMTAEQARVWKKPDPKATIQSYYRQYPASYIQISDDSWHHDPVARIAYHSFTLKNTSAVSYDEIQVRFDYKD